MTHVVRAAWLAFSLCFSASVVAVPPEIVQWGWRPPVEFAGQGNPQVAIEQLRNYIRLQRLVMDHTDYHEQTQAFVDDLWQSLESFDLEGFYWLLPDEQESWRSLTVYGEVGPEQYHIGPAPRMSASTGGPGLGNFRAEVKAQEIDANAATHYLLSGEVGIGLGDVSWSALVDASQEALRMVGGERPVEMAAPDAELTHYRRLAETMNPELSADELDLLVPLWASYPDMWNLLSGLGELNDLLVLDHASPGYQEVRMIFTVDPERLAHGYPHLADYLDRLDTLVKSEFSLYDEYGRLLRAGIDSETLQATLNLVVRDGQVVPVRYERPVADAPRFDPAQPRHLRASIDARMDILGIIADVEDMTFEIDYQPTGEGARFVSHGRSVPRIGVGGRALGVFPAPLIDVFLPKRIDQLMKDFLTVACEGNERQGITGVVEIGTAADDSAQLHLAGAFEGLDNFFVRIGMGIINNRIIPNERVSEDLRTLVYDAHQAFSSDLDQFEQLLVRR